MELLLILLVLVAIPVVFVSAKRGAEAAQLERTERWRGLSGGDSGEMTMRRAGARTRIPAGSAGDLRRGAGTTGADAAPRTTANATDTAGAGAGGTGPPPEARAASAGTARLEDAARRMAGTAAQGASATARSVRSGATAALRRQPARVDINRASVAELQSLPGIGVRAAERIVAHRERHGDFGSVEDLAAVEGFDQHRVGRLAPHATVGSYRG